MPRSLARQLKPVVNFELTEPVAELPITLGGIQIMVEEVFVNGEGSFRFVLDTGAQGGGQVDSTLAGKFGLEPVGEAQGSEATGRGTRSPKLFRNMRITVDRIHQRGQFVRDAP